MSVAQIGLKLVILLFVRTRYHDLSISSWGTMELLFFFKFIIFLEGTSFESNKFIMFIFQNRKIYFV
jgi:hypothetical protein